MRARDAPRNAWPTGDERGFTLAEAIVVIAVTGAIAAVVAVFIQKPVQGYFDAVRRAQITDEADLAVRRMARDVRTALPNSVRVTSSGAQYFLEFLETTGGGRYRYEVTSTGTGNILDFSTTDTSFEAIAGAPAAASGSIVVGNLGEGSGADAYAGNNITPFTGVAGGTITMGAIRFPVESEGKRFFVVSQAVSYVCAPAPAGGTLTRYSGYGIVAAQPATTASGALASASASLIASDVTSCSFAYQSSIAATRTGVASIWLELSRKGESARLFHQIHVVNTP